MAQLALDDYPDRYRLANELHARPSPELAAPCRAVFLALKQPEPAADRDREADRAHLRALLDRYGAPHPPPAPPPRLPLPPPRPPPLEPVPPPLLPPPPPDAWRRQ